MLDQVVTGPSSKEKPLVLGLPRTRMDLSFNDGVYATVLVFFTPSSGPQKRTYPPVRNFTMERFSSIFPSHRPGQQYHPTLNIIIQMNEYGGLAHSTER